MAQSIRLVSVNVGKPEILTVWPGGPVYSAIHKRTVAVESLVLTADNLDGDAQADRRPGVHGGPEKAILAYASEHFPHWRDELGEELGPGAFGENLTTKGITEAEACIGDVWSWGEALLQVSQPRGLLAGLDHVIGSNLVALHIYGAATFLSLSAGRRTRTFTQSSRIP